MRHTRVRRRAAWLGAIAAGAALAGLTGFVAATGLAGDAEAAVALPTTTVTLSTPVATATVTTPTVTAPPAPTTVTAPALTTTPATATVTTPVATAAVPTPALPTSPSPAATGSGPGTPASGPGPSPSTSGGTGAAAPGAGVASRTDGTAVAGSGARGVRLEPARREGRRPARLVVVLRRPGIVLLVFRGPGRSCALAGTRRVRAKEGANRLPITGRVRGGRLPEGLFRLEAYALAHGARPALLGRVTISLAYDDAGRARVRAFARGLAACAAGPALSSVGGAPPVAGERAGDVLSATAERGGPELRATGDGVPVYRGSSLLDRPREWLAPLVEDPQAVGGLAAWLLAGLTAASLLLFLGLLGSHLARALRG